MSTPLKGTQHAHRRQGGRDITSRLPFLFPPFLHVPRTTQSIEGALEIQSIRTKKAAYTLPPFHPMNGEDSITGAYRLPFLNVRIDLISKCPTMQVWYSSTGVIYTRSHVPVLCPYRLKCPESLPCPESVVSRGYCPSL